MTTIENPIHCLSCEDVGALLLGRENDKRRLQQAGADHRGGVRLGHGDGTWRVGLERMRILGSEARERGQRESAVDDKGNKWIHGTVPFSSEFVTQLLPGQTARCPRSVHTLRSHSPGR